MPPILQQKTTIVALAIYLVGAILHVKGRNLSTDQTAMLTQAVGFLFDIVATNLVYLVSLHHKNAAAIEQKNSDGK